MRIGIDVGSTTIKYVVLDENDNIIHKSYERHLSQITEKTLDVLKTVRDVTGETKAYLAISGSAGMGISEACGIPLVQEVFATRIALKKLLPDADVAIELGGEDAKILFVTGGMEFRMNGSCAGGTGAFIDQMATLLNITPAEMNEEAKHAERRYTIASRCGVFAKTDIQPLLNQGARTGDISSSIFYAVVNQTIAGLAQGRPIKGNVVYLGGPLTFFSELRNAFDDTLKLKGVCPENSLYYVAMGAAFGADEMANLDELIEKLSNMKAVGTYNSIDPLFRSQEEYEEFTRRHSSSSIEKADPSTYVGDAFLGVDAGSTTIKMVVITPDGKLLLGSYNSNKGNPVPAVKHFLEDFYKNYPDIHIIGATSTGYGEELVKNAFSLDSGIVETMAHLMAAQKFMPDVEFVIDIGGQDIKCFKIGKKGEIDSIFLNEACSSGCGSFLQTFAEALKQPIDKFAKLGLFADKPVDLGSRCTVFMNSSVKQAQKDGASIENISAGLSISVVKNALYKVIRASSPDELGKRIVVQGGTFLNDAVLRAFEQEMGVEVVRPTIAGLMGAYGAALYASRHHSSSGILTAEQLANFSHEVKDARCGGCSNNCRLTINIFDNNRRFISGNRCEKPITKKSSDESLNIYDFKLKLLKEYKPVSGERGKIGIPMGLNMFELLPFWHTLFTKLGFEVVTSELSNRKMYLLGQATIPSDTVCFPAKLMHGHIQTLINQGVDTIFYPCMSYNIDEKKGDNHYNCPVVAYYPEVIQANMPDIANVKFIDDYLGIHRSKDFPKKFQQALAKYFDIIPLDEIEKAVSDAYSEYDRYMSCIREYGDDIIKRAREQHKQIIVLSGRPYHIDPEINHGIDKIITSCGAAIVSEDVVSGRVEKFPVHVLNQWTYHSRLYSAAKYVTTQPDMNLVQLVSFGCGIDAITTDEVRSILEDGGKIYTQIKIDEITNLGAVRIRLRSLFAAIEE